jgi:hypothetical protein
MNAIQQKIIESIKHEIDNFSLYKHSLYVYYNPKDNTYLYADRFVLESDILGLVSEKILKPTIYEKHQGIRMLRYELNKQIRTS